MHYQGYVSSRPIQGSFIPQRVQNLVIREYAVPKKMDLFLSATEYAMENSVMLLRSLFQKNRELNGVVLYSLWQLEFTAELHEDIYAVLTETDFEIHCALENLVFKGQTGFDDLYALLLLKKCTIKAEKQLHIMFHQ